MHRLKWVDRKFNFDVPPGWLPNICARLNGTGPRLKDLVRSLSDRQCSEKPNGKWSIKEHIGHLSDLEKLHEGRLQDFINRKEVLRAADMQNVATEQAQHNQKSVETLIEDFVRNRNGFIKALRELDDETHSFVSQHPRLRIPMKPVDMATFTAEHDDHHLASIAEIILLQQ
jgi:hypothetical protein